jgi:hypothetical protein
MNLNGKQVKITGSNIFVFLLTLIKTNPFEVTVYLEIAVLMLILEKKNYLILIECLNE